MSLSIMSPTSNGKGEATTNLDDPPKPSISYSESFPYLSPPNSPKKDKELSGNTVQTVKALNSHLLSPPPSPPRQSSELAVPEKQVKEDAIDAATLKALLGLTTKRCGAPKPTGQPCGGWSPVAKRAAADSQLQSMTNLTQSSVNLGDHLDKLARLVHCKYHDGGLPKKNRIEAWRKLFPVGEVSVTDPIILVEEKIEQLLALKSTKCLRILDGEESRCEQRIGGLRVSHCALTIKKIITSRAYLIDSQLEVLLEVLERSMYCPQHRNEKPLQNMASWKSIITGFLDILPKQEVSKENEGLFEDSNTYITTENPSTNTSDSPVLTSETFSILDSDQDLSDYWPTTYNILSFDIVHRNNGLADYKYVHPVINKPLETVDLRDGYMYMYEVEGNAGFVKIGYTTKSVDGRLEEWEFDCNRAPKALYPIPSSTAEPVPHARRVEALCHAELDHRRIRIYCPGCLKQHLEWFEISSTEAIAVIQKWSTWIKTNPYKPPALRNGKKWTIKIEETIRTERMDEFMNEISAASSREVCASNGDLSILGSHTGDMDAGVMTEERR